MVISDPSSLTHHLGAYPLSGTQRDDHAPTEDDQRRQRNDEHDDGVEQVEIDARRSARSK